MEGEDQQLNIGNGLESSRPPALHLLRKAQSADLATELPTCVYICPSPTNRGFPNGQDTKSPPGPLHKCQTLQNEHMFTPSSQGCGEQHQQVIRAPGAILPIHRPLEYSQALPNFVTTAASSCRKAGITQGPHVRPEPIQGEGSRTGWEHTL